MITLHFHLLPQYKYELFHIYFTQLQLHCKHQVTQGFTATLSFISLSIYLFANPSFWYLYTTSENSLKITRVFRRVQFERIFKYHKKCKSITDQAFSDYPVIIICSANKKLTIIYLLSANHSEAIFYIQILINLLIHLLLIC